MSTARGGGVGGALSLAALLLLAPAPAAAGDDPDAYDVVRLAEGVYGLVWREQPIHPEPNVLIVVDESDVLVVDSSMFPSTAATVIREIKKLTPKPVRYVVNTHWHDDHVFGNFVYRQTWPSVEFVAHPNTRKDAAARAFGAIPKDIEQNAANLERYQGMLRTGMRDDGTPIGEAGRKRVERAVGYFQRYAREAGSIRAALPDVTFDSSLVLQRGSRTIELHYLGRGNTRGDVVVYLPRERILATGDLVVSPTPFGIGSYYAEWIDTLGKLMKLDAGTLFLAHGSIQHDLAYVRTLRDLLAALVSRVSAEVQRGSNLEAVRGSVTLADWKERLAGGDEVVARAFDAYFVAPAVERAYRQARGEPDDE